VRVGVVAVDGTKIAADASGVVNMTEERLGQALDAEARRIIEEAKAIDAAEDEAFGDARGDELPGELADRSRRLARLRTAKARLVGEHEASATRGSTTTPKHHRPLRVNATDPDSRVMKTPTGFVQGFNAQAAVTTDQLVVAAELTSSPIDVHQLEPLVAAAKTNVAAAGVAESVGVIVADAGYYSTDNATMDAGCELLIAPTKGASLPTAPPPPPPDPRADTDRAEHKRAARFAALFDRTITGELTLTAAADELGMSVSRACVLRTGKDAAHAGALERPSCATRC
jgi:hypothetical protein